MEIKKQAKFRVIIKDVGSGRTKVITVYQNNKKIEFQEFIEGIKKKLKEW